MGVNLPARLVVIKGTRRWTNEGGSKGYQEYDHSACLQMMGRAGRPQFDTHGVAVIMTQSQVSRTQSSKHAGCLQVKGRRSDSLLDYLHCIHACESDTAIDKKLKDDCIDSLKIDNFAQPACKIAPASGNAYLILLSKESTFCTSRRILVYPCSIPYGLFSHISV